MNHEKDETDLQALPIPTSNASSNSSIWRSEYSCSKVAQGRRIGSWHRLHAIGPRVGQGLFRRQDDHEYLHAAHCLPETRRHQREDNDVMAVHLWSVH